MLDLNEADLTTLFQHLDERIATCTEALAFVNDTDNDEAARIDRAIAALREPWRPHDEVEATLESLQLRRVLQDGIAAVAREMANLCDVQQGVWSGEGSADERSAITAALGASRLALRTGLGA